MKKELLLAGNTSSGFINYFDSFINGSYTVYIKGASGIGKSTFMKEMEKIAQTKGYSTISVPCSSDINSYDVLKILGLNVTIVDATAPHIFEPKCYGIDGEIYDFGKFVDGKKLQGGAGIVKDSLKGKAISYKCLYNELKIARLAMDNIASLYLDNVKDRDYFELNRKIIERVQDEKSSYPIEAFLDYLDSSGYHEITSSYVDGRNVVVLSSRCADISENILEIISNVLQEKGIIFEKYHSILSPQKFSAIATKNTFFTTKNIEGEVIDVDSVVDNVRLAPFIPTILKERSCISHAIKRASMYFKNSRVFHENIENIYLKAMDFPSFEEDKKTFTKYIFNEY